jgi:hypothetical protein
VSGLQNIIWKPLTENNILIANNIQFPGHEPNVNIIFIYLFILHRKELLLWYGHLQFLKMKKIQITFLTLV